MTRKPRLLLCMTPGMGLARWKALGSLERELKPYVEYLRRGWDVTIATYDRPGEVPEIPPGLELAYCPHHWLRPLAPWFLRRAMQQTDVIKTNQSRRSSWYVLGARVHRRPIVVRCGWLPGSYLATRDGLSWRLRAERQMEAWTFRNATACMVATTADRNWIIRQYGVPPERIHLRPNFVDTELFRPGADPVQPRSVIAVGRLNAVKNPHLLIEAAAASRLGLVTFAGEGPEQGALEALARRMNVPARFPGSVPQAELPALLRSHAVFAMPSKVEGHPKALFEAMACGMACVGANVPGVREAIHPEETGLLREPRAAAFAETLGQLMVDAPRRQRLGRNARRYVEDTLSFQTVMNSEIRQVRSLLPGGGSDASFHPQPVTQAT
jgi:glycosyltransferase involved in cell wall biosynthesis